jgi:hypothetical protein
MLKTPSYKSPKDEQTAPITATRQKAFEVERTYGMKRVRYFLTISDSILAIDQPLSGQQSYSVFIFLKQWTM